MIGGGALSRLRVLEYGRRMSEFSHRGDGCTAARYFAMVDEGLIAPDDKVELLEGLIVAMSPQSPEHATTVWKTVHALERALAGRALVRCQVSFLASERSVPEPDVCVVEGSVDDYSRCHPRCALLMVEVAASTLAPDRLTKSRIYAAAAVPEYWIINVRDRVVEIYTQPDAAARIYTCIRVAREGERIALTTVDQCEVAVTELLVAERRNAD